MLKKIRVSEDQLSVDEIELERVIDPARRPGLEDKLAVTMPILDSTQAQI